MASRSNAAACTLVLAMVMILGQPGLSWAVEDKVLFDFEQQEQLAAWGGNAQEQGGARQLSLEAPEVTAGGKALKIVCTGEGTEWPGISTNQAPKDWTGYQALKMDVYSVNPLPLNIRIDDSKSTDYPDRFNYTVNLRDKKTLVQIPIESIARSINPADIKLLCIFLTKPPAGTVLHIDNIRLGPLEAQAVTFVPFEQRKDAAYTDAVKTPVAWQVKPLPGGPVHLFAIPSIQYGREIVELAQRLDIQYGTVTWDRAWDQNTWGLGDHYSKRGHRFDFKEVQNYLTMELAGEGKYDVYVIRTPVGWKWFPKAARDALLARVREGAGLVLVQPFSGDDKADVEDLWSISPLTHCKSDYMEEPSGYMKPAAEGIVTGEPWRVTDSKHYITADLPLDLLPFEAMSYCKYQVAPGAQVLVASRSGDPIVAVQPYGKGRVVTLAYRPFDMTPHVEQAEGAAPPVDYAYWEVGYALVGRCVLWAAGREAPVSVPEDFVRRAKTAAENPIVLRVPDTVGLGDRIRVQAGLTRESAGWRLDRVELFDGHGRLIEQSGLTISTVFLPTGGIGTWAANVVVTASDKDGRTISRSAPVIVRRPTAVWDDYEVIMWPNERLPWQRPVVYDQMRRWGCTATLDPGWENDALMRERLVHNMRIVPHGVRRGLLQQNPDAFAKQKQQYELTKDMKYLERFTCISDPKVHDREKLALWKSATRLSQLRPLAYCIGEEDSLTSYRAELDLCFAYPTLRKFREYLKGKYQGDLNVLNQHWGTKFAAWEKVMPMTSEQAKVHKNFAPWAEHRTFMDNEWAGIYALYLDVLKRVDNPSVLMGTSGTQVPTPHDGQDWSKLMPLFGWLSSYTYGHQDEMHLSFAESKSYITAATGYGISAANARYQLWTRLFHGNAGAIVFWWLAIQNPDLSVCQAGQDLGAVIGELRGGAGRLVFEADRQHDPIAVHYSIPSMQAGWITTGDMRAYETAVDAWWTTLQELGYQPKFVAGAQIERGVLGEAGYKVLVMPRSVALSAKEKEQIDAFVKAGGVVLGGKCEVGMYDADLAANPVALVPDRYEAVDPAAGMDVVAAALERAGVQQVVGVKSTTGAALKGLEIVRYQLDDMQMIGILRPPTGQKQVVGSDGVIRYEPDPAAGRAIEPVRVSIGSARDVDESQQPAVYDVRTHKRLEAAVVEGSLVVSLDLPAGDGTLLAVVPGETGVRLEVPETVQQGGDLTLTVGSAGRARRVIRVEVRQPDGSDAPWLTRNVVAKGQAEIAARMALDDKLGTWLVTATDVATGSRTSGEFSVTATKPDTSVRARE